MISINDLTKINNIINLISFDQPNDEYNVKIEHMRNIQPPKIHVQRKEIYMY